MKRLLTLVGFAAIASTYGLVAFAESPVVEAPTVQEVVAPPATTTTTTTTTTTIAPEPPYSPPEDSECPQWHQTALDAGWAVEDLPRIDYIMWRESRCFTDVHNAYDPMSGSRGVMQINGFWCRNTIYNKAPNGAGWLELQGILTHCNDLYDPLTNLIAAKAIWEYSEDRNGCGWLPWTTRNTRWC
jgi:hypothetical protein